METLTPQGWAVVAGLTFTAVFASLYILSSILRDANRRIDLHRRVEELREEYARQLRELSERGFGPRGAMEVGEVDIVEDEGPTRKAA